MSFTEKKSPQMVRGDEKVSIKKQLGKTAYNPGIKGDSSTDSIMLWCNMPRFGH